MQPAPHARTSSSSFPASARRLAAAAGLALATSSLAQAQLVYSIDYKGATKGQAPGTGTGVIRESDILFTVGGPSLGPLQHPSILRNAAQLGLSPALACATPAGFPCDAEVDALSFGDDKPFHTSSNPLLTAHLFFSVDYEAQGTSTPGVPPTLFTEAAALDVASDVYTIPTLPPFPVPPNGVVATNALVIDGNGLSTTGVAPRRGLGLLEPHLRFLPPQSVNPPWFNPGDDLDALHISAGAPVGIFFSVDGSLLDPQTTIPGSGTNTAIVPARPPGSILFVPFGGSGSAQEYATASTLGLDRTAPGSDDLDVLIVHENGQGGYQKSIALYDWLPGSPGGATDMVVFSVRRGSAVIGALDFLQNLPIEEGDLLVPPPVGLASLPPGIVITAENLGLRTRRAGFVQADDLDAGGTGDVCYDCNNNGIEDAVDIATGSSADANGNGIPDECESSYTTSCECPTSVPPPCGNDDATAGCKNSTGAGGKLTPVGTSSASTDDLVLNATQIPGPATGIWLRSSTNIAPTPLKDGLFCLGSRFLRFGQAGPGAASKGPGMVTQSGSSSSPMTAGSTWNFQYYYRNVAGPCHLGANLTNMVTVTWTP